MASTATTAAAQIKAAADANAIKTAARAAKLGDTGFRPLPRPLKPSLPEPGEPMGTPSNRGGRKTRRRFKKHRLMSRKYCKKTPCRRMGFTQRASCRPYKNCYRK